MPTPSLHNLPNKRVHVTLTDAKTRKSKGFTLYGVNPAEAMRSIKRGLELLAQQDAGQGKDTKEAGAA